MLDVNTHNQSTCPPPNRQQNNLQHPETTAHAHMHKPTNNPATPSTVGTTTSNNTLPRFAQVTEAASLRCQAKPNCTPTRDPLDNYNKGITTPIQDADPGTMYAEIDQNTYDEWEGYEGEKLLAIPFKNDTHEKKLLEDLSNRIFAAVVDITNSDSLGVASPPAQPEGEENPKRFPNTFLIYSLSPVHAQILTQQTVWASSGITFRIITPPMKSPSFMFSISGLRTMDPNLVRSTVRALWNDETTTNFILQGVQDLEEDARNNTIRTVQAFMDSMWVMCLETKGPGATQKPTFNIHTDGTFFENTTSWSNLRTHLANQNYHSSRLGQGKAEITPYRCALCHGVDHPKGLCPFPLISGWKGPRNKLQPANKKRGCY